MSKHSPQRTTIQSSTPKADKKAFVTVSPKGGSGKTTLATLCKLAHRRVERELVLSEYDPVRPLAALYPGKVDSHSVAPDFEALMNDPAQTVEYFGPLLRKLRNRTVSQLIDTGSPLAEPLINVMRFVGFGESIGNGGAHLRPIIPTTTDIADLKGAAKAYAGLREIFPEARIALVISERNGQAGLIADTDTYKRIADDPLARVVIIRRAPPSSLFSILYGTYRIPPEALVLMKDNEALELAGSQFDPETIGGWLKALRRWLLESCDAFGDFFPQPVKKAA